MALKVSQRGAISPFIVMDMMRAANERAQAGGDVLHLEVGQPSTPAPALVRQAAHAALDGDLIGYTDAFGLMALRVRLAQYYQETYGVTVDPARIAMTTGSSGAFVLSFLTAFDAGDRVALASPGYPCYRNILGALGIETVSIPVGPETNFQPTAGQLAEIPNLDGLIIASPSNPTGTMLNRADFLEISSYCQTHGVRLISDEIYHGITYGARAISALEVNNDAIVINSFSKYFSMTGWRLGWVIFPSDMSRGMECLAQNLFISAPTLSQHAAIAAFDCRDELEANVARYAKNREVLLNALPQAGFDKLSHADGAFYIYADVSDMTDDSIMFCERLLHDTGVAITPGVDFDPERGQRFVRFSFAGAEDDMIKAVQRLKAWQATRA